MWLKALQQWLERKTPTSDEQREEEFRAQRERRQLELRKAEVIQWFLPPPC